MYGPPIIIHGYMLDFTQFMTVFGVELEAYVKSDYPIEEKELWVEPKADQKYLCCYKPIALHFGISPDTAWELISEFIDAKHSNTLFVINNEPEIKFLFGNYVSGNDASEHAQNCFGKDKEISISRLGDYSKEGPLVWHLDQLASNVRNYVIGKPEFAFKELRELFGSPLSYIYIVNADSC